MLVFLSLVVSTVPGSDVDGRETNSGRSQRERLLGFSWLRAETCRLKKLRSVFYPKMRCSIWWRQKARRTPRIFAPQPLFPLNGANNGCGSGILGGKIMCSAL